MHNTPLMHGTHHWWLLRAYCTRSQEASVITSDEERAIWIPARLLVAATRDPELYSYILDTVLRNGLLPAKLDAQAAARHWALIYMSCSEQERYAVAAVLRAKAKQQQDVQAFLAVRGDSPAVFNHTAVTCCGRAYQCKATTEKEKEKKRLRR